MPFQIIRNDITKVKADAIVNTANPKPRIGRGTDSAIYAAAGEEQLIAAREKIGDIAPGQAVHTAAFALDAKYIIHTVGPVWVDDTHGERDTLRFCYENSLALADSLGCESIAFPLIATGTYGFPKDEALHIALSEIRRFLLTHEMKVTIVVFDRKVFSRIRCKPDYKSKKKTALAFAIALELDMPTMTDLLSRAEIALSPSNTFDLIITYFITNKNYDIFEINAALFKYGQPILGE